MVRDKNLLDKYINKQEKNIDNSEVSDNKRDEQQTVEIKQNFYFIEEQ